MQSHYDNYVNVVDTSDDASMDEIYVTYVDDKHVDKHDYDDTTDDDHDKNNDIYGHISMIYRRSIDDLSMIYRRSIDDLSMIYRSIDDLSMIYRWSIDDLSMIYIVR